MSSKSKSKTVRGAFGKGARASTTSLTKEINRLNVQLHYANHYLTQVRQYFMSLSNHQGEQ